MVHYIDLHVQTIFFFFFFFLLCFSPLLLQLCSRQFDSKLFGGEGEANDTSQEKRKLEAYMSDLRPPLCQKIFEVSYNIVWYSVAHINLVVGIPQV